MNENNSIEIALSKLSLQENDVIVVNLNMRIALSII